MGKKKKGSAGGNSNANKAAAGTKEEASEMKAVTLEFNCLCDGCLSLIKIGSYKATLAGPPELSVEQSKCRVTVKGKLAVDPEFLANLVRIELGGRSVAVVPPPKKEGDGGEADKKNKGGDGDKKDQPKGDDPPQTGYTRDGGVYWYGYPAGNIRPQPFYHPGWGCPCGCSYPQICQCGYNPQMFSYSWLGCGGY